MFDLELFPKGLLIILETLKKNNFKAYVVGGSIRDLLLKLPVLDWDITTEATPEQVAKLFKKVVPTGIAFGTVTVIFDDGEYEVTTFRSEEKYSDGRRPDKVSFTKNLDEDLSRRDFTINALAYDPLTKELVDRYNGQKDLKDKLIRAVGDPVARFREDGLRPFRACRFAAKLGFDIEEKTLEAISKSLDIASKVAPERVHDEIMKILETEKPSSGFELMRRSGLLKLVIPELENCFGVEQPRPYHKYDVYWHSLYSADAAVKDKPIVRLAVLLHDIAKPACKVDMTFYNHDVAGIEMAEKIMKRLRFSNADIEKVKILIKNHMFNYTPEWSDAGVRRFMRRVGLENLEDLFELRRADLAGMEREFAAGDMEGLKARIKKVIEEQAALKVEDLKVNGHDVMKILNLPPGPKVGEILNHLLEKVLDDPKLNEKEILLKMIMEYPLK